MQDDGRGQMPKVGGIPDSMSDVLSLVRMRAEFVCANDFSAPWSLSFRRPVSHFHIVERGSAWLKPDDGNAIRIETGDLVILPLGAGHVLCSDPALNPLPADQALTNATTRHGSAYAFGGGGAQTHVVCGRFSFAGVLAPKLLKVLPALIHIEAQSGRPLEWMKLTSHFLVEETRYPKLGSAIAIARLLDLLFVEAVREWGARNPRNLGWLSGLADPAIGRALSAMHEEPARRWTVEALADLAGLSRSAFAARFSEVVGQTPLRYLAAWRLDLAADQLRAGVARIGEIAATIGYGSEAALTRAFKAQFNTTPAAFRRAGPTSDEKAPSGWIGAGRA
ncbi:MAG: AraC family transcriptional regulator [Mesorhizobium sp.]|nr:MAG: AraC family transcriptional regulator [Mesorhizobium sp.]RWC63204.1 MAG: AraC family transcriptional regulator [Mesorhizobium sp.]